MNAAERPRVFGCFCCVLVGFYVIHRDFQLSLLVSTGAERKIPAASCVFVFFAVVFILRVEYKAERDLQTVKLPLPAVYIRVVKDQ